MKSRQVDFSRVTLSDGSTVSIDTSYISEIGTHKVSYFETAAHADGGKFIQRGQWQVLEQYNGRDQALAGHHLWAKNIRENGLPATV